MQIKKNNSFCCTLFNTMKVILKMQQQKEKQNLFKNEIWQKILNLLFRFFLFDNFNLSFILFKLK